MDEVMRVTEGKARRKIICVTLPRPAARKRAAAGRGAAAPLVFIALASPSLNISASRDNTLSYCCAPATHQLPTTYPRAQKDTRILVICGPGGTLETTAERKLRDPRLPAPVQGSAIRGRDVFTRPSACHRQRGSQESIGDLLTPLLYAFLSRSALFRRLWRPQPLPRGALRPPRFPQACSGHETGVSERSRFNC